jgi:hypothetical protein
MNQTNPNYNEMPQQFNEDQIKHNIAFNAAEKNGTTVAHEFCAGGMYSELSNPMIWPQPFEDEAADEEYSNVDIFQHAEKDPLSDYCKQLSEVIKFPINTTFLHGLGVVSSAMNLKFRFNYEGDIQPTSLYVVTAQPPSTGKSGINGALSKPVRYAYAEVSKKNKIFKAESELKIAGLEKQLAQAKQDMEIRALLQEIEKEQEFLASVPVYTYAVSDTTAEALESMAGKQGGLFNIVSAEADAINVLMGGVYGGAQSKANHGIFLSGWDGEHVSVARVTRETSEIEVRGSIAVIAQDESINSILEAGRSGRGVSERMLILREKSLLGTRKHKLRESISPEKKDNYAQLVNNIVNEQEEILLEFTTEALQEVCNYRNVLEPQMLQGEAYSNNLLIGVVGKADKQIYRLASVLHACKYWKGKIPKRKKVIEIGEIRRAIMIYSQLVETFIDAADSKGFVGEKTELTAICDWIQARKEKTKGNKAITIRQLRDGIKRKPEFAGVTNLTSKIKTEYLPELERRGVVVFDSKFLFVNPKL